MCVCVQSKNSTVILRSRQNKTRVIWGKVTQACRKSSMICAEFQSNLPVNAIGYVILVMLNLTWLQTSEK